MTGTPGVGKTTTGRMLAKRLGIGFIDLPEFVSANNLYTERLGDGTMVVDPRRLERHLSRNVKEDTVIAGHITVRVRGHETRCIVLRLNPLQLRKRLEERGYSVEKVAENVEAEFLGVVYLDAIRVFGKNRVSQIDVTGKEASDVVNRCVDVLEGRDAGDDVEWMSRLDEDILSQLLRYLSTAKTRGL